MKSDTVIWHDVECASYDVDLPLWRELAKAAGGAVLDIGCGTGRVALDLARRGHAVTGLDSDADLVKELAARARKRDLDVNAVAADARSFDLGRTFALAIAPMQVWQLMDGPDGRRSALETIKRHLEPGACFAIALANPYEGMEDGDWVPPYPDMLDVDGWVYASTPQAVRRDGDGAAVERKRQVVSPKGEVSEWLTTLVIDLVGADEVEAEAAAIGFTAAGRRWIPETDEWVGSTVVMLEAT